MEGSLIPIFFNKILQTRSYTALVLGTEEKSFAIYTDPQIGKNIHNHLSGELPLRPQTHDFIHFIFNGLNIKPLQVVINAVEDTVYFARLFVEQEEGNIRQILEIDARPSDCISLALLYSIPMFCCPTVLEKAIPFVE
jgi:uncharacterized protein